MTTTDVRLPEDGSIVDVAGLVLEPGSVTVLYGPNGAGKTTVLRHLAGIGGREPVLDCCYQPQAPYLFRGLAGENLGLGLSTEESARAGQIAADLGIRPLLTEPARSLSGGERQRLALARTLARAAEWVLLDEPLNAVDRSDRERVMKVLATHLGGRSAVVVTHDLDVTAALGDRVAVLGEGRLLQQGSIIEVLRSPASAEVARILGVGNLIDGVGHSAEGLTVVESGGIAVIGRGTVDGSARALIPAESIVLGPPEARGTSARNRWNGRVTEIRDRGQLLEVVVDVGVDLVAVVTPGGAGELDLQAGSEVSVSVKAAAIVVVPS